jgi:predicted secreted protein
LVKHSNGAVKVPAPVRPVAAKLRVALISHCLGNQNAKVDEYASYPGVVSPVIALLRELGYTIQQMPCPELTLLGPKRWWQVREQYDSPGFRRHCRLLAHSAADLLEAKVERGVEDVVVLGIDGSPSSGVGYTSTSGGSWGGRPEKIGFAFVPGKGVWIEELERVLADRGLPAPRMIGVPMELPGFNLDETLAELRRFLTAGREAVHA